MTITITQQYECLYLYGPHMLEQMRSGNRALRFPRDSDRVYYTNQAGGAEGLSSSRWHARLHLPVPQLITPLIDTNPQYFHSPYYTIHLSVNIKHPKQSNAYNRIPPAAETRLGDLGKEYTKRHKNCNNSRADVSRKKKSQRHSRILAIQNEMKTHAKIYRSKALVKVPAESV
ncbi:unnamed protein product [Tuber aestivum]|uniref:Uncharacterized protein n=1 Tax=Tuber aestivum TaxID=59557 RepID=A0A292Q042_9PEZI|nr:unnamed protein product [Tuber aestivum]